MIPVGGGSAPRLFRLFGIPVHADIWFLIGLLLVAGSARSTRAGLFAAAALAVFTLLHELGHAVAARAAKCRSSIRLSFLVAWASYQPTARVTRTQEMAISAAGPLTQLVAGLAALGFAADRLIAALAAGDADRARLWLDVWSAIGWAGVLIALLNLLPLWPLDGGHIAWRLASRRHHPQRAQGVLARFTLAVCVAAVIGAGLFARLPSLDAARTRYLIRHQPAIGDSLLTTLVKEIQLLPVRMTEPFVAIFVGVFCGLASWRVIQAQRGGW